MKSYFTAEAQAQKLEASTERLLEADSMYETKLKSFVLQFAVVSAAALFTKYVVANTPFESSEWLILLCCLVLNQLYSQAVAVFEADNMQRDIQAAAYSKFGKSAVIMELERQKSEVTTL